MPPEPLELDEFEEEVELEDELEDDDPPPPPLPPQAVSARMNAILASLERIVPEWRIMDIFVYSDLEDGNPAIRRGLTSKRRSQEPINKS